MSKFEDRKGIGCTAWHFPQKGPHSDRLWPERETMFHIEGNCKRPQGERAEDNGMPPELLTFRACRTWKSQPGKASDQPRTQRRLSTYVQEGAGVLYTCFPAATHVHCRYGLDDLEKGGTKVGHIMPSPSPHSSGVLIG